MSWFNKKKEKEEPPVLYEGKPIIEDWNKDPYWYAKKLFVENTTFSKGGNYCVIDDNQFEGVPNNIDLLEFMLSKGWEFVNAVQVDANEGIVCNVEYIFKKKEAQK